MRALAKKTGLESFMVAADGTAVVGYARVSTLDQNTDLQIRALRSAGCVRVFQERVSSVKHRPELLACLASLKPGDTLVVYKLDRLARSLRQLLEVLETLQRVGVAFRSCTEPVDTATPAGMLMLQMLGAMAQFERSLIVERTAAGQAAARARGVRFGRSRSVSDDVVGQILGLYFSADRLWTMSEIAQKFGCSTSAVKRIVYSVKKPGYRS